MTAKKIGKDYKYPMIGHIVGLAGKIHGERKKLLAMADKRCKEISLTSFSHNANIISKFYQNQKWRFKNERDHKKPL